MRNLHLMSIIHLIYIQFMKSFWPIRHDIFIIITQYRAFLHLSRVLLLSFSVIIAFWYVLSNSVSSDLSCITIFLIEIRPFPAFNSFFFTKSACVVVKTLSWSILTWEVPPLLLWFDKNVVASFLPFTCLNPCQNLPFCIIHSRGLIWI